MVNIGIISKQVLDYLCVSKLTGKYEWRVSKLKWIEYEIAAMSQDYGSLNSLLNLIWGIDSVTVL